MPYFFMTFLRKILTLFLLTIQIVQPISCTNQNITTTQSINVIDGDTFDASNNKRYRLIGIDTPEIPKSADDEYKYNVLQTAYGLQAKEFTEHFLKNNNIEVEEVSVDTYKRTVAKVRVNNIDLSLSLLEKGLAIVKYITLEKGSPFVTTDYDYYKKLLDTQLKAYKLNVGIWNNFDNMKEIFP